MGKEVRRFIQGFSIAFIIALALGFGLGLEYGRGNFTVLCETSFNGEIYEDFSGVYCCADWNDTILFGTNYCKSQKLVEYELPLMNVKSNKSICKDVDGNHIDCKVTIYNYNNGTYEIVGQTNGGK